uniref:Uncharacterized protein n=1 Tax=Arundo donax TaxID=35708 RepID=A0A0A9H8S3_ARUDO
MHHAFMLTNKAYQINQVSDTVDMAYLTNQKLQLQYSSVITLI